MADARQFINPDLAHEGPPAARGRTAERPRTPPGPPRGGERGERYQHYQKPGRDGSGQEEAYRPPPPRFDFHGEDLLKLLDGLTQSTVLAGIPTQFEPPPKLREAVGKILDQMGFPEDLLPAQAFDPKGRWKILAGCILAYAGLGAWQALKQRQLTMALIKQQMEAARAARPSPEAGAGGATEDRSGAGPGKEDQGVASVERTTDSGNEPH